MRAVYFPGNGQVDVREAPEPPAPGPGQVLVAMRAAALCGTDVHTYHLPAEALPAYPIIRGHAPAGVVAAVGPNVSNVAPGDRVTVYQYLGCGTCRHCYAGYVMWCAQMQCHGASTDGAFTDLLLTNDRNCLPLPPALSLEVGTLLACTLCTAYQGLTRLAPFAGQNSGDPGHTLGSSHGRSFGPRHGPERLIVFGVGPVGLATVLLAHAMGADVLAVDLSAPRLALAREFGASATINAAEEDVLDRVLALTDGEGADAGVEASGAVVAQQQLIGALRRGGRGCIVGMGSHTPSVNLIQLINKQLTIHASNVAPITAFAPLMELIQRKRLPVDRLITHRFQSVDQAPEALRLLETAATGAATFVWS